MMNLAWLSARGWHGRVAAVGGATVMAWLLAGPALARQTDPQQQPPAQEPAQEQSAGQQPAAPGDQQPSQQQPQQPQANPFMFEQDAGMVMFFIKADKTADFEKVLNRLHVALANSDRPERRQMAQTWKVYKSAEPGPNNTVLYVNLMSPVLKGADYTPSKILADALPQEAQVLFGLYRDAFAGISRAELQLIADFSAPPKPEALTPVTESPSESPAAPPAPQTPQSGQPPEPPQP